MARTQVGAVPVQAPLQPENVALAAAVAVRVTTAVDEYGAVQVVPQLIPPVLEVTVPLPFPDFVTVNVTSPTTAVNVAVTD
jgi:hypothetical protein